MPSLRELLGIDRASASQRRARALVKADQDLLDSLIAERKSRGLTQQDVADRLGITQAAVAAFERYDNDPKLSTLRRYAHAVEAFVVHAVEADRGQLETAEHEFVVTMRPVTNTTVFVPGQQQQPVRAASVKWDLALAA